MSVSVEEYDSLDSPVVVWRASPFTRLHQSEKRKIINSLKKT